MGAYAPTRRGSTQKVPLGSIPPSQLRRATSLFLKGGITGGPGLVLLSAAYHYPKGSPWNQGELCSLTNLWFVNEEYPAACKSKICGQRPGRECIFTANASICSAKNARNDVHAVISDLSPVLPILCQYSGLPLESRGAGGASRLRGWQPIHLMIYNLKRKSCNSEIESRLCQCSDPPRGAKIAQRTF